MIKIFYITVLLLISTITIKSQKGFNVVYEADYKLLYKSQKGGSVQDAAFALLINEKESYYKNMNKYIEDSLRYEKKYTDNSSVNEQMKYITEFPENIGTTKGKLYVTLPVSNKQFKYEEANNIDWKLVNEFKTVANFKCQKAITQKYGRTWIAYFASDIPLPFGPYKFNGLPGLILEIYDDKKDYVFSMYSFRKRKYFNKSANIYPNATQVNKSKVFDYQRKEMADPNMFAKFIQDPDARRALIKKAEDKAKNYNPIELSIY